MEEKTKTTGHAEKSSSECYAEMEDISFLTAMGLLFRILKNAVASGMKITTAVPEDLFDEFLLENILGPLLRDCNALSGVKILRTLSKRTLHF